MATPSREEPKCAGTAPLEDTFADIIGKARYGLGLSLKTISTISSLPEERISNLEEEVPPLPTEEEARALAKGLNLDARKLWQIAQDRWHPKPIASQVLNRVQIIAGRIGTYPVNGYLLIDPVRNAAVLFDTGYSPVLVLSSLEKQSLRLIAICITHTHPDHIGGADVIHQATGAPIYLHRNESYPRGHLLEDEKPLTLPPFIIYPLATPGHTPGGTSYLIKTDPAIVFVGDALFAGSLGRASTPSTYSILINSVRTQLLSLQKETVLFPGHGPATTVCEEQTQNPFFI